MNVNATDLEHPAVPAWEALTDAIARQDSSTAISLVRSLPSADAPLVISRLDSDVRSALLSMLRPDDAADLLEQLHDDYSAELVEELPARVAAAIVEQMDSDDQADVLGGLSDAAAEAVFAEMAPEEAQDAKKLLQYDRHTAGGLMITEFLSYQADAKLSSVINDLNDHPEKYHNYDVQYLYVVDSRFRLQGVVPTRRLLFHEGKSTLHEVMISKPHSLKATANLEELSAFFREHDFFGVPIIEDDGKLAGVVQRKDLRAAMQEASDRSFLHLSGILGGEEFRSMPIIQRSFRRGAWLVLNVCLNMLGASVIALNQDTLQAAIALAVFLPMISDMSGCSGNQAVAVSIRELTLGLVKPTEIFRVVIKESKVGFLNGLFLGILLGGLAWLWKSNIYLSLIVGVALMINTILSVCLGGMLPLISKRFKLDPAMVSSPILTTCTDVCGFFLVLGGASLVLDKL